MARLTEFFLDDESYLSCMRLMCVLVDAVVLGVWVMANIKSPVYVPLGVTEAGLICMAHGCKYLQSREEYGANRRA